MPAPGRPHCTDHDRLPRGRHRDRCSATADRRRQHRPAAQRSVLRRPVRRQHDPRQQRQDHPAPAQSRRRPRRQQSAVHHHHRQDAVLPQDQGLHRTTTGRRTHQEGSHPSRQAV